MAPLNCHLPFTLPPTAICILIYIHHVIKKEEEGKDGPRHTRTEKEEEGNDETTESKRKPFWNDTTAALSQFCPWPASTTVGLLQAVRI